MLCAGTVSSLVVISKRTLTIAEIGFQRAPRTVIKYVKQKAKGEGYNEILTAFPGVFQYVYDGWDNDVF